MKMRSRPWYLLLLLTLLGKGWMDAQATPPSPNNDSAQDAMSRDLLEVTIPELEQMYRSHQVHRHPGRAVVLGTHREIQRDLSRRANGG